MNNGEALGPSRESLGIVERRQHLRRVTLAWLNGEIGVEIYREARDKYGTNFREAVRALARQRESVGVKGQGDGE